VREPLKKRKLKSPPSVVGWREWASFPDFGVKRIKAKIDTGAKTSALHAYKLETFTRGDGHFVHFAIHPIQRKARPEIACTAEVIARRRIKSSNGASEERLIIRARVKLGQRVIPIDLSLANRDAMGFRLLLGRDALKNSFVIDPARSYLQGAPKKRLKR
jgi:hypothetical protein